MKQRIILSALLWCYPSIATGTSLVYNIRIRRIFTNIGTFFQQEHKPRWAVTAVPITIYRTSHITNSRFGTDVHEKRLVGGSLFNLRYVPSRAWWAELTAAAEKETVRSCGTANFTASRSGFDDIVVAAGHNMFPTENTQFTFYLLGGIPTRKTITAEEAQERLVGTRTYSIGGGAEASYSFLSTKEQSLAGILQGRTIYFFPRSFAPIIPGGRIQPGFVSDIVLCMRYRHGFTSYEIGYNPTIFSQQAIILPTGEKIRAQTAVRHGGLMSVTHLARRVTIAKKPVAFGAGILFNHLERFDARSFGAWFNMTIII